MEDKELQADKSTKLSEKPTIATSTALSASCTSTSSSLSSWPGPRTVFLQRTENGFGFTLRHFIVYPPETLKDSKDGCATEQERQQWAAVGGLEPMDTIFVKHVKEGGPAQRAGLATGDRIVSVNGEAITGKAYSEVVQLIQKGGNHLQLLVVPKEDDILQLYFSGTAYHASFDGLPEKDSNSSNSSSQDISISSQPLVTSSFNQPPHHHIMNSSSGPAYFTQSNTNRQPYGAGSDLSSLYGSSSGNSSITERPLHHTVTTQSQFKADYAMPLRSIQPPFVPLSHSFHRGSDSSGSEIEVKHRLNGNAYDSEYGMSRSNTDLSPISMAKCSSHLHNRSGSTDGVLTRCVNVSDSGDCCSSDNYPRSYRSTDNLQRGSQQYGSGYGIPQGLCSSSLPSYTAAIHSLVNRCDNYPQVDSGISMCTTARSSDITSQSKENIYRQAYGANNLELLATNDASNREPSSDRYGPSENLIHRFKASLEKKEEFLRSSVPQDDSSVYVSQFRSQPWFSSVSRASSRDYFSPMQNVCSSKCLPLGLQRPSLTNIWSQAESKPGQVRSDSGNDSCMPSSCNYIQPVPVTSSPKVVNTTALGSHYSLSSSVDSLSSYNSSVDARGQSNTEGLNRANDENQSAKHLRPFVSTLGRIQENLTSSAPNYSIEPQIKHDNLPTNPYPKSKFATIRKANSLDSEVAYLQSFVKQGILEEDGLGNDSEFHPLQLVSHRMRQFESGSLEIEANNRTNLYKNELARLTSKGHTTSVSARAAQFESRSTSQETLGSENDGIFTPRQRNSLEFKKEGSRETRWQRSYSDNTSYHTPAVSAVSTESSISASAAALGHVDQVPTNVSFEPADEDDDEFPRKRAVRQNSYLQAVRSPYRGTSNHSKGIALPSSSATSAITSTTSSTSTASSASRRSAAGVIRRKKAIYEDEERCLQRRISYVKANAAVGSAGDAAVGVGVDNGNGMDDGPQATDPKFLTPTGPRSHSIQKLKAFFGEKTPHIVEATEKPVYKDYPSPIYDAVKEGWLHCKNAYIDGKRATDRSWKQVWGCLRDSGLYLYKDKKDSHQLPLCLDEQPVVVRPTGVEVAYDYTKKKNVFRLTTVHTSEYLLQAEDNDDMLQWIRLMQEQQNNPDEQERGLGNPQIIVRKCDQHGQDHNRLSPQPMQKGIKKLTSFRNRSPTGHSPIAKNRKSTHLGDDLSPKAKTWRGKMVKTIKKIHGTAPSSTVHQEGITICIPLEDCPPSSVSEFVPLLVELCTSIVEARGLEMVGIYRVPGNTAAVTALLDAVNKGFDTLNLQDPRWNDVNVISSVLKAFFRKLPEPLVTIELYPLFIEANKIEIPIQRMYALKKLLHELPDHHFETFKFLIEHLRKIVAHSKINKMEARNLAIVFGPTLVRAADDNMVTMVTDMSHQCRIVETLIINGEWFFSEDDDDDILNRNIPLEFTKGMGQDVHLSNQNLLLNNIQKVEHALPGSDSNKTREICAKDLVASIISAANRKVRQRTKKHSVVSAPALGEDAGFEERDIDREVELRRQRVQRHCGGNGDAAGTGVGTIMGSRSSSADSKNQLALGCLTSSMRTVSVDSLNNLQVQSKTVMLSDGRSKDPEKMFYVVRQGKLERSPSHDSLCSAGTSMERLGEDVVFRTYAGLSANTQERIRQFELETRALLQRDLNKQQRETEKQQLDKCRIEQEWQRAKRELEQDDPLDALADNPSEVAHCLVNLQQQHLDTNSITSDYSTISSSAEQQLSHPFLQKPSSSGIHSTSDYSSNAPSPATHHRESDGNLQYRANPLSDYNSNTSSGSSDSTFRHRQPAGNVVSSSSLDTQCKSINKRTTNDFPRLVRRGSSVENIVDAVESSHPPVSKTCHRKREKVDNNKLTSLQRTPSVRCGSLDSLREFYDNKDTPSSFASSEDSGDLLSSITKSLDKRLQVLLLPSQQMGLTAAKKKDKEKLGDKSNVSPPHQHYRDPSLHRTKKAEPQHQTSAKGPSLVEPRVTSQAVKNGRRPIVLCETKQLVTASIKNQGSDVKVHRSGRSDCNHIAGNAKPETICVAQHVSPTNSAHSRSSETSNDQKATNSQDSNDGRPVDLKVKRNENPLITATLTAAKQTVTTSTTTSVITATTISKSIKTELNLKDKAKDDSKQVPDNRNGVSQKSIKNSKNRDDEINKITEVNCDDKAILAKVRKPGLRINSSEEKSATTSSSPPIPRKRSTALRNIKRRHTVGGTKDFDQFRMLLDGMLGNKDQQLSAWERLQPAVQEQSEQSQARSMRSWLERERLRTSYPDLATKQPQQQLLASTDPGFVVAIDIDDEQSHHDRRRRVSLPESQLRLSKVITLESQV